MNIIYESETYRLKSYGGGLAYTLEHKKEPRSLFWQGDDASQFNEAWQAFGDRDPHAPFDRFFAQQFEECEHSPPKGWQECDICGGFHPPRFAGDCRDDKNRWPVKRKANVKIQPPNR